MTRLSLLLALLLAACASSPPPLPDPHPRVPINRTAPPAMPGGAP